MKIKKLLLFILCFLSLNSNFTPSVNKTEVVDFVELPSFFKFNAVNTSIKVSIKISPFYATNKNVKWVSSNPSAVSVTYDSNNSTIAIIKCLKSFSGYINITATCNNKVAVCNTKYKDTFYNPDINIEFYPGQDDIFAWFITCINNTDEDVQLILQFGDDSIVYDLDSCTSYIYQTPEFDWSYDDPVTAGGELFIIYNYTNLSFRKTYTAYLRSYTEA